MNHDEPDFENELKKFSVVKLCPKCKELSLSFKRGSLICENCGYMEKINTVR